MILMCLRKNLNLWRRFILCLLLCGCATRVASPMWASLPQPPEHPALQQPELLSDHDRARLAQFYRRYQIYLLKLHAWKKAFGAEP